MGQAVLRRSSLDRQIEWKIGDIADTVHAEEDVPPVEDKESASIG